MRRMMLKRKKQHISLLLVLVMVLNLFVYSVPASEDETKASDLTENVETTAKTKPEVTETEVSETEVPETEVPETKAPETKVPETKEPDAEVPETEAPEMKVPATKEPVSEASETETSVVEKPGTEPEEVVDRLSAATPEDWFVINASGVITGIKYNSGDRVINLEIPSSVNGITVRGIGASVFSGQQLESVVIPATVTSIGASAFKNNAGLTSVTFAAGSQLKTVGNSAFEYCTALSGITLADSVTSIGERAFYYCQALTDFVVPAGTTILQKSTFQWCTSLKSITFHDHFTEVGMFVFAQCSSLKTIELPDSLITIGYSSFSYSGLLELTIPRNVKTIEEKAFTEMGSNFILRLPYHYPGEIAGSPWNLGSRKIYWSGDGGSCFYVNPSGVIVGLKPANHNGGDCDHPAWHGVDGAGLGDVIIPKQVGDVTITGLLPGAFLQNKNIRSITFEAGSAITEIPNDAFYDCPNLTSVTLCEGIVRIGERAFKAGRFTSIELPQSLQSIGEWAFVDSWLKTVTIPAAVNSIEKEAFYHMQYLESVIIEGSGALSIGPGAFPDTENMVEIKIPGRSYNKLINGSDNTGGDNQSGQPWSAQYADVEWADDTFDAEIIRTGTWHHNRITGQLTQYTGATGADVDLVVPYKISYNGTDYPVKSTADSLLLLGEYNKVTIAEGYTTELGGKFLEGAKVNEIVLPSTLTALPFYFARYTRGLKRINLPPGLTSIDTCAFEGCTELTQIDGFLPAAMKTIGNKAFHLVPLNLADWQVPDSVRTIGENAFADTGLTGILKVPSTVSSMATNAFVENPGITEIQVDMYRSTAPENVKSRQPWGAADAHVWYKGEKPESTHAEVVNDKLVNSPLTQVNVTSAVGVDEQNNPVTSIRGLWIVKGTYSDFPESEAVQIYENRSDSSVNKVTKSLALPSGTYTVFAATAMMTQDQGQTADPTQYIPYTFEVNKTLNMSVKANDFHVCPYDLPLDMENALIRASAQANEPCYNYDATLEITEPDLAKINALLEDGEKTKVMVLSAYTGDYDYTNGELAHPFGDKYAYTVAAKTEITVTISNKHTVTFDANVTDKNPSAVEPGSIPSAVTVNHGAKAPTPTTTPIRPGFEFKGWYKETLCTNPWIFDQDTVIADVTLYAKWEPVKVPDPVIIYTVTFDKNGGDTEAKPGVKTVAPPADTIDALPSAPTRKGYTFEGWNTRKDGKGTIFTAATKVNQDITVYAQWKKDTEVLGEEDANYDFIKMADTITVKAGQTVSYTMSGFGNKHKKALTNYEISDRPNEGISFVSAQLPAFTKGAGVTYDVIYTTKKTGLHVLHNNVSADQALFVKAPKIAADDFITGIVFSFASVPAGFGLNDSITLTFKISEQPPSTKLYNDAVLSYDLDGKSYSYGGGGQKSTVTLGNNVTGKSYNSGRGSNVTSKTSPKTGDNSSVWFFTALMLAAAAMTAGAVGYRRKKIK